MFILIVLKNVYMSSFLKCCFNCWPKKRSLLLQFTWPGGLMADFFLILRMVSLRRFVSSVAFFFYFLVAAGGIILSHLYLSDDVRKMFLNLFLLVSCQKCFFLWDLSTVKRSRAWECTTILIHNFGEEKWSCLTQSLVFVCVWVWRPKREYRRNVFFEFALLILQSLSSCFQFQEPQSVNQLV